ncbi:MAG TPA: R3H domain-containing nucleic acid-binding protein [Terriglobia bacterium]|nr:R3H domain-containing nucleic acid-binding protein [Terriglobia bacterium]
MESPTAQAAHQPEMLESYVQQIESFLREICARAGFGLEVSSHKAPERPGEPDGPEWIVDFSGRDSDLLLESRAELLDSLGYLALKVSRLEERPARKIAFDCQDYRRMHAEELRLTARLAAERVIDSGKPFSLNPMNSSDRRVVHLALKDQPLIRTESQGMGPGRHVVILPASPNG